MAGDGGEGAGPGVGVHTPAVFPGRGGRRQDCRDVEKEERAGGWGQGGGHCLSRSHPTNTPPFLGINCTFGVIFLEEEEEKKKK